VETRRIKGRFEGSHFVKHDAHGPHISTERIRLCLDHFGGQVVGCSDHRLRLLHGGLEHLGNAKVADLDNALLRQKHILSLQISVNNFSVMDVFHSQANLGEPVEYLAFGYRTPSLLLDPLLEITSVSKVHDNAKLSLLGFVDFDEGTDVGMSKGFKQLGLLNNLTFLLLLHPVDVDHLHNALKSIGLSLDEVGHSKGALSKLFDFRVVFELRSFLDV